MTRVTQLIHDAGKYLLISVYPLPTHHTHNFTHTNGGSLETLPGWPKKLQHNRPARSAGQLAMEWRLSCTNPFLHYPFCLPTSRFCCLPRDELLACPSKIPYYSFNISPCELNTGVGLMVRQHIEQLYWQIFDRASYNLSTPMTITNHAG